MESFKKEVVKRFELDEKYAEISQQKLEQVKPNFKIGETWVSSYLKDIVTIRNNDWEKLEQYFTIPEPIRAIDYQKVALKSKSLIPKDFEFQVEENEVFKRVIVPFMPIIPKREKVAAYAAATANYSVYKEM